LTVDVADSRLQRLPSEVAIIPVHALTACLEDEENLKQAILAVCKINQNIYEEWYIMCLEEMTQGEVGDQYLDAVRQFADTMIEHGRDHYGVKDTPLFLSILDVETLSYPEGELVDGQTSRQAQRSPEGSNLLWDNALLRTLDELTVCTGDPKYRNAVDDYLTYYLAHCPHPTSGFFPWGFHCWYGVFTDDVIVDGYKGAADYHEFKNLLVDWERMWNINPEAVIKEGDAIYQWHIHGKTTFLFNRHAEYAGGKVGGTVFPLSNSAANYVRTWCFLYSRTGEPKYLEWANGLVNSYWIRREPDTNLIPTCYHVPGNPERELCEKTVFANTFCLNLIDGARFLSEEDRAFIMQVAEAQLKGYIRYFIPLALDVGTTDPKFPYIMNIDGTWRAPRQYARKYGASLHKWRSDPGRGISLPGFIHSFITAYDVTKDSEYLAAAETMASCYVGENLVFAAPSRISADSLGRAIWVLNALCERTGHARYKASAEKVADFALEYLYTNGIFRAYAGHPYYEAYFGVPLLAEALVGLCHAQVPKEGETKAKGEN